MVLEHLLVIETLIFRFSFKVLPDHHFLSMHIIPPHLLIQAEVPLETTHYFPRGLMIIGLKMIETSMLHGLDYQIS